MKSGRCGFFSHCPGAAPRRGRWRSITRAHRGVFALPTDHTDYGPPPRPPTCTLVAHNGARASSRRPLSRAEVAHGDRGVMAFCRCYRHCTGTTRTLRSLCASAGLLAWCCMCFLALISPGGGGRDGAGDEKNESESRVGQKTTSGVIGCRKTPCGQRTCSAWSPNPNPGRGHGKHWDASGSVRGHISPVRRPVGSNTPAHQNLRRGMLRARTAPPWKRGSVARAPATGRLAWAADALQPARFNRNEHPAN